MDQTAVLSGLNYGTASGWLEVTPGPRNIAVGTSSDPELAEISLEYAFASGDHVAIIVATREDDSLFEIIVSDDLDRSSREYASIIVVHAVSNQGPLNFVTGATEIQYINFPSSLTSADGIDEALVLPGEGLAIEAWNTGAVLFSDTSRRFLANRNYIVIAYGSRDDLEVMVLDPRK